MKKPMTIEYYELCRVRFGCDISGWPEAERVAAEAFLLSEQGREFEQAEADLDGLLAQNMAVPAPTDGFLSALKDIPVQQNAKAGWLDTLLDALFGGGKWLSPVALASQAAVYLAVLGMGLMIGMQSAATGDTESVDLSDSLFASNAELFLEEE